MQNLWLADSYRYKSKGGPGCGLAERFKTQAAHFPIQRDERTGMQRATFGNSGSEAASYLQGRIARGFSSNFESIFQQPTNEMLSGLL